MEDLLKNLKIIKLNNKDIYTKDKSKNNIPKKKIKSEIKKLQLS